MIRAKIPVVPIYRFSNDTRLAFASTKIPDEPELIITIPLESSGSSCIVVLELLIFIPLTVVLSELKVLRPVADCFLLIK
jgi:hypothetical protein